MRLGCNMVSRKKSTTYATGFGFRKKKAAKEVVA